MSQSTRFLIVVGILAAMMFIIMSLKPRPRIWIEDGTGKHPYNTIEAAFAAAKPGDTVYVGGGVYAQSGPVLTHENTISASPTPTPLQPGFRNNVVEQSDVKAHGTERNPNEPTVTILNDPPL